jgi:hypothetical protein
VCRAAASAPAQAAAAVDAAAFETFLLDTQKQILAEAEKLDGGRQKFVTDRWERPNDTGVPHGKLATGWRNLNAYTCRMHSPCVPARHDSQHSCEALAVAINALQQSKQCAPASVRRCRRHAHCHCGCTVMWLASDQDSIWCQSPLRQLQLHFFTQVYKQELAP